jgi:bifunctional N-acetylglucosamine-1-phosphate-uridyltransferase/glucosamine-1-phosphate-acetyltransferase GlmU-like protein
MAAVRELAARKRTFHAVRLLMRTRHVDGLLIAAILLISTAPLYAQRQQQNVAKLKEDARNAVGIIGADRGKTQSYCQIVDLGRQMNQAVGEKDQKKAKALVQEIVQLRKQLPEFVVLENVVKLVDLNSPDGREIAAIIRSLNQSCPE